LDQCRAIVIRQSGAEVLSQAFRGPSLGAAVPVKSVSKTIVAALTGAALDRGELPSLRATLGEVAPNLIPAGADPRVADITVENLVTMQAGLERTSGANYGSWGECPIFCVTGIWSMLSERSKDNDNDNIQGTAGRTSEGLRAA
jgi:CubicO group peptidase (beta-lactamase class C family)